MRGGFVVDASVAVKWLVPQPDSDAALSLLESEIPLVAPRYLHVEVANALWFLARSKRISLGMAVDGMSRLRAIDVDLWSGREPVDGTIELAIELDHAIYDCAYLALARELEFPLVTADAAFGRKVGRHGRYAHLIRPLDRAG